MRKLSRREFLKRCSLGAAGAYAALRVSPSFAKVSAGGAKGEGAAGIIDPPIGALFKDPPEMPNLSTTPGVVEVQVEARPALVNVNGTMATLLAYNGAYPAPTIRVKSGDRLNIHFRNSLPAMNINVLEFDQEVTNLHTHGLHVSPLGESDNVTLMFVSGNSFDYQLDLVAQEPGTLNCYHPLSQGTAAEQYWGGLAGALAVEDENTVLAGYETHILVLKDITLSGGAPEPYSSRGEYLTGREGDTVMVNGQVNPELMIRPGQVQRWRVMNASNARFYKLSLENHSLQIIGTDAGLLDKPYSIPFMLLAPGERLDLLVKGDQAPKSYRLLSLPYDRGAGNSGRQVTLMTLSYKGAVAHDALPVVVNPVARRSQAKPVRTERIVLTLGRAGGFINGRSISGRDVYTAESELGTYEAWEIVNRSGMDIPFSLQVNPFQVVSISGGDPAYASFYARTPAWKDTVIVPRHGSVKVVVPVMDFTGLAVFYSRILEHADLGMMGIWDISKKEIDTEVEA
jgi:FtsP/CotA-like multicopper oxidase with cupredoxin domain